MNKQETDGDKLKEGAMIIYTYNTSLILQWLEFREKEGRNWAYEAQNRAWIFVFLFNYLLRFWDATFTLRETKRQREKRREGNHTLASG